MWVLLQHLICPAKASLVPFAFFLWLLSWMVWDWWLHYLYLHLPLNCSTEEKSSLYCIKSSTQSYWQKNAIKWWRNNVCQFQHILDANDQINTMYSLFFLSLPFSLLLSLSLSLSLSPHPTLLMFLSEHLVWSLTLTKKEITTQLINSYW